VLQCVALCCSVLQCVAVCCSVLQCVAVCSSVLSIPPSVFLVVFALILLYLLSCPPPRSLAHFFSHTLGRAAATRSEAAVRRIQSPQAKFVSPRKVSLHKFRCSNFWHNAENLHAKSAATTKAVHVCTYVLVDAVAVH